MAYSGTTTGMQGAGPMGKAMAIAGMAVGGLIALAFAADLFLGIPFGGRVPLTDIGFMICGVILAYLSWNAFRDVK
jgi:hypothetical protein